MKNVAERISLFSLGLLLLLVTGCSGAATTTTVTQATTAPPSTVTTTATTTAPPSTVTMTATITAPPSTVTTTATTTITATATATVTTTATSPATTANGSVSDPQGDVAIGFVDIVSAEVEHDGEIVTGTLQMANLPATFVFNQAPQNYMEYGWQIMFDVDNDAATGGQWGSLQGVDYVLMLTHTSNGGPQQQGSLLANCQATLLQFDGSSMNFRSLQAAVTVNIEGNTIVLKGSIPGLNENSWWAVAMSYNDGNNYAQDHLPMGWYR